MECTQTCKSGPGNLQYMANLVHGGNWLPHLNQILDVLSNLDDLEYCGLQTQIDIVDMPALELDDVFVR